MRYRSFESEKVKRRRHWKVAAIAMAVLLVFVFLFREPLMVRAGQALVADDPPREADAIVVLMGSIPDRVVHGVDLYRQGYADSLVMIRTREYEDYEIMEQLKLEIPGTVDINKDIALQLDMPKEDIIVLDYGSDSTYDEAVAVKEYLGVEAREKETMIVVTSKYHSARSKKIFERVLGDEVEVLSSPSPYDPFDPESWWKHRNQARSVLFEYQKFINFYLFQR